MKSKIIDFFDYNTLEIPTELKKWHIPEEEIQNELEALAADNASQAEVTAAIAVGDSVRCVCTACGEKAWIGRTVLIYPGRCQVREQGLRGAGNHVVRPLLAQPGGLS